MSSTQSRSAETAKSPPRLGETTGSDHYEALPMTDGGSQQTPLTYMRQLDGLRAIAVALVCIGHWVPPTALHQLVRLVPWGALGVHLFFVLSGYLITSILLRCRAALPGLPRRRAILAFYARRFLRIFPAYYALLGLLYVLDVTSLRRTVWWHALYLSNIYLSLDPKLPGRLHHFWSLASEEQFYLCLPWVMLLCPAPSLPGVIVLIPVAGFLARLSLLCLGVDGESIWLSPLVSCDTLSCGSMLAWRAWRSRGQTTERFERLLPWVGAMGLTSIAVLNLINLVGWFNPMVLLGPTSLGLFGTWFVWRAASGFEGVLGTLLQSPPVVYLGRISYGLYLFHNFAPPTYEWLVRALGLPTIFGFWWLRLPIFFAMTLSAAALSWRYFEKPLLDLKRFLPYAET